MPLARVLEGPENSVLPKEHGWLANCIHTIVWNHRFHFVMVWVCVVDNVGFGMYKLGETSDFRPSSNLGNRRE